MRSKKSKKSDPGFGNGGGFGVGATDNYKMYTWSPYSATPSVVFDAAANGESRLNNSGKRNKDELRF